MNKAKVAKTVKYTLSALVAAYALTLDDNFITVMFQAIVIAALWHDSAKYDEAEKEKTRNKLYSELYSEESA